MLIKKSYWKRHWEGSNYAQIQKWNKKYAKWGSQNIQESVMYLETSIYPLNTLFQTWNFQLRISQKLFSVSNYVFCFCFLKYGCFLYLRRICLQKTVEGFLQQCPCYMKRFCKYWTISWEWEIQITGWTILMPQDAKSCSPASASSISYSIFQMPPSSTSLWWKLSGVVKICPPCNDIKCKGTKNWTYKWVIQFTPYSACYDFTCSGWNWCWKYQLGWRSEPHYNLKTTWTLAFMWCLILHDSFSCCCLLIAEERYCLASFEMEFLLHWETIFGLPLAADFAVENNPISLKSIWYSWIIPTDLLS